MFRFRRIELWLGCALALVGLSMATSIARNLDQSLPPLAAIAARDAVHPQTADSSTDGDVLQPTEPRVIEAVELLENLPTIAPQSPPCDEQPEPAIPHLRRIQRVTAYCDRGTTAAGVPSGVGQCAAPADIPFGSKVYIPELDRTFIVTDRTHRRFRHNTVDIFIPSKAQCRKFGKRYLECQYTIVDEEPAYGKVRVP